MVETRSVAAGEFLEVFPLHRAPSSRALAATALVAFSPVVVIALFGAGALIKSAGAVGIALGLLLAVLPCVLAARIGREVFPGRAYLAIRPGSLVLRHGLLLRKPLEVPFEAIERVAVKLPGSPGFWDPGAATQVKEDALDSWLEDETEPVEALDSATSFMLPLASNVTNDEPNVAVVFRTPVEIGPLRQKSICAASLGVKRLNDVDETPGFLARVEDPESLAYALAQRGLLGRLSQPHAGLVRATDDDVERLKKFRRQVAVGRVVVAALFLKLLKELFLDVI